MEPTLHFQKWLHRWKLIDVVYLGKCYESSVTRLGEFFHFGNILKTLVIIVKGLFSVWLNFDTLTIILFEWANFHRL